MEVPDAVAALYAEPPIKKRIFRVCAPLLIDTLAAGRIDVEPCAPASANPHHRVLRSPAPAPAPACARNRVWMAQ
ncbi:hypothetical protein D3867_14665 (plasmid) [Azospirillum argentinense]|uniref:Uncharacterized protein n=1 Tax=Azospirillum brasilense TaxID=192 RepID=A0A4D8QB08_AZOBR|nr:hypothetical protein D3867_14665 [Azospirillum argentinense]